MEHFRNKTFNIFHKIFGHVNLDDQMWMEKSTGIKTLTDV